MKKFWISFLSLVCVISCAVAFAACGDKNTEVTKVALDKTELTLEIGETATLKATVLPDDAEDKTVIWSVGNSSVATVSNNGLVTAVSAGTTTVTATAGGKSAVCEVTVKDTVVTETGTVGLEYSLTADKTAYICTGLGTATDGDIIIAAEYDGLPVTEIKESAFEGNAQITSVKISKNIAAIGRAAFANCTNLTTVYWNAVNCRKAGEYDETVHSIFRGCTNLTEVIIADNVTFLPEYAFFSCSRIKSIIIPDSVTQIHEDVFKYCYSLETVTLGKGINIIRQYAFEECTALTDVYYAGSLADWCNIDFGSMEANPLCYAKNLYIDNQIVTDLIIPTGVTAIRNNAFVHYGKAESLIISDSVSVIENNAFRGCSGLTNVIIPNSVSSVYGYAFAYCRGLNEITIGEEVKSIGLGAFRECSNLSVIKWNAADCSVNNQLYGAFDACKNVTDVTVGEKVIKFSTDYRGVIDAFSGFNGLKRIAVNEKNTAFSSKNGILYNKAGTEILYIPKGVEGEIEIPNTMTQIGASAFSGCTKITKISIPDTVQSIGMGAFANCTGLSINYLGDLASWCAIDFNCSPLENADNFYVNGTLVTEVVIPDGVTELNNGAFSGSKSITSIVIPDSVTFIEENALGGCKALVSLTIPFVGAGEKIFGVKYDEFGSIFGYEANDSRYNRNVPSSLKTVVITGGTSIASHAFEDCYYIEKVTLPASLKTVGSAAFNDCRGLNAVYYTGDLKSWCGIEFSSSTSNPLYRAHKLFINNVPLTDLVIPEGTTKIGSYSFYGCREIANISIPDTVISIGSDAFIDTGFYNNEANWEDGVLYIGNHLIKVKKNLFSPFTMKDGTITIAGKAFADCIIIYDISLPVSVVWIGYNAFGDCEEINFSGTTEQWKAIVKNVSWSTLSSVTVNCLDGKLDKGGNLKQ